MSKSSRAPKRAELDARIENAMVRASSGRDRIAVWFGSVMCGLALTVLAVTPTHDWQWASILVLTLGALLNTATGIAHRHRPVPQGIMLATTILLSLCNVAAFAAMGPFTIGVAITCLMVFGFGMSANSRQAFASYAINAVGFLLVGVAYIVGAIPNQETVLALQTVNPSILWVIVAGGQVTFAGTYWLARETHYSLRSAFEEAHQLKYRAHRHEAALQEVHRDLRSALAHGRPGRLTGTVVGSYELRNVIGRGGAGEVYRAYDEHRHGDVAVKILHATRSHDPTQVKRFIREAQVMSGLRSEHIARVFEVAKTSEGCIFLAMERLEGDDLAGVLRREGPMPIPDVLRMVQQLADGLSVAHRAGVVHRDVKPQNIFRAHVQGGHVWKLLDFGISKVKGSSLTLGADAVIGTPGYMAPEQIGHHAIDGQTDVFALAAVVYRALTGAPPFAGHDLPTQIYQLMRKQPADPRVLSTANDDVARVLALGLSKDREGRFGDVDTFASAFEAAVASRLPESLRVAADAAIAEHPWGTVIDENHDHTGHGDSVTGIGAEMYVDLSQRRPHRGTREETRRNHTTTRQHREVPAAEVSAAFDADGFSSSHRRRRTRTSAEGRGGENPEWRLYG